MNKGSIQVSRSNLLFLIIYYEFSYYETCKMIIRINLNLTGLILYIYIYIYFFYYIIIYS